MKESFAATQMDPEIIIASEISQTERPIPYITYMWNVKYDPGELLYRNRNRPTHTENSVVAAAEEDRGSLGLGVWH